MTKKHNDPINRFMLPIAGVVLLAAAAWLFFSDSFALGRHTVRISIGLALVGAWAVSTADWVKKFF